MNTLRPRLAALAAFAGVASSAVALPMPDIRLHLDATFSYEAFQDMPNSFHLYDPMGRTSIVSLTAFLETGLRAFVSERIERISGDPSRDPFEEYYVEDEGIWRLGKQFLPFGSGTLLKENVLAASGNAGLLEHLNLHGAVCDAGPSGAQRGFIARLGERFGISAAVGRHFGISPTSLDEIRLPNKTPGLEHGWKQVVGADGYQKSGLFTTRAELAAFSGPETPQDGEFTVMDASETFQPDHDHSFTVGWTRRVPQTRDYYRIAGSIGINRAASFVPMIRFESGRLYDVSMSLRIRL